MGQRQVSKDAVKASAAVPTGAWTSDTFSRVEAAEHAELWVIVTDANGGSTNAKLQAAIVEEDTVDVSVDTQWVDVPNGEITGINANGVRAVAVSRQAEAFLGSFLRVVGIVATATMTFSVIVVKKE